MKYNPNVLAVSCVLGGRQLARIAPIWSKTIGSIGLVEYEHVKQCYERLMQEYLVSNETIGRSINLRGNVLETNRNISNQPFKSIVVVNTTMNNQIDENKFDIKRKKHEIENLKKAIKEKLISLNNKSRTIETLLKGEIQQSSSNSFRMLFRNYSKSMIQLNNESVISERKFTTESNLKNHKTLISKIENDCHKNILLKENQIMTTRGEQEKKRRYTYIHPIILEKTSRISYL